MFITHAKYAVTDVFWGFIGAGRAYVGLDLDDDAWGLVVGKFYAGWTWE
jgi:hypothetical protein